VADDRPSILLLDGHSLAYRAFFALPDTLRTQTGALTNAVYGFTSMLIKMLAERRPDAITVAFDKGRDVARTEAYPEYKANRSSPPDEFRPQVDLIKQVLASMQIPVVEVAGVEADDVLATIADRAIAKGFHAYVVTGDRDAMQLASDDLTVLYTLRGISEMAEMTPAAVEERYGVAPSSYVAYAALRGDNSDNLPGVPGVGEKTAAKLITQFGDLDGVFDNIDQVGGKKVPAALEEHEPQVRTNERIMTLRHDVDVEAELEDLRVGQWDTDEIRRVFGTLEFRALYDRFVEDVLGDVEEEQADEFEATPQRVEAGGLAAWLDGVAGPVALVCETGDHVPHLRLDAVAVATAGRDPASLRLADAGSDDLEALAAVLADPDVAIVSHDAKLLTHVCRARGWDAVHVTMDVELAAYLLNPEQRSFDLDRIALQYLQRSVDPAAEDDAGDQLALDVDDDAWEARALRAQATLELGAHLGEQLDDRGQSELLATIELPLAPVLSRMEQAGIAIDRHVLDELHERLVDRARDLELEVHDHAGHAFNVGSGPQLQTVLFEELELPRTKRIKTGWSTDATQLQNIIDAHPIVPAILEWRETTKLLSTYVDALPPLIDDETGRIHTTLSQTVAATGRLSSSNPNLQNIPVRREEGREIRRAFVPGPGFDVLLVADYSQIELRVMAHLCQDEGLLDAFRSREDIHATTAAKVFDLPIDAVDSGLRDRAKAVNYGLAYGLTPFGLGQQLGIPPDEASEIVDAYFDRFPLVREFLQQAVVDATKTGFTTTLFGRRRYLPDLLSSNRNRQQMAQRMALNAPIQGTAADIIKLAMIRVQDALDAAGLGSQMLLQVHDEIILECPRDEVEVTTELVVEQMAGVADLRVPLEVDTAVGATWFDAQKH
jgi:DNA polymerase-1